MSHQAKTISIKNKKAAYQYHLLDSYTAGIQLMGTEIKSIREGKVSLGEAYCTFDDNELFLKNSHISEYEYGSYLNHNPKRDRKLLLTHRELHKLQNKVKEKGFTIIPVTLFINDRGLAKLEIALARGKHYYDKRETLRQKEIEKDIYKTIKSK